MRTVLFLCTGNYYRSRFAEELFNHLAQMQGLGWRADSRALAIERLTDKQGHSSPLVVAALNARSIRPAGLERPPRQCTRVDLEAADLIVALCDREHRPLVLENFPDWHASTEYWQVEDIGITAADEALTKIEKDVTELASKLSIGPATAR